MAYILAANSTSLSIVSGLISLIPLGSLSLAHSLGIYGLLPDLAAVKAVNRFSGGRAVATPALLVVLVVTVALAALPLTLRALPTDFPWSGAGG
ncbi:MAG: hypothetical protein A2Y93_03835 [Chloroflexi bacterium RBG_13_68_17]|nr:MAG: hypothetical protein A2Y93_03835 [Chloroflexi bacterium RBG_13_68_17]